MIQLLVAMHIC